MKRTKGLVIFALSVSAFVGPFGGSLLPPVFNEAAKYFNVPVSLIGASISIYIFPFAVFQLFAGFFSDLYGKKKMMVLGTLIYSLAALLIYFTRDFYMFLALRILQGLGSGLSVPVSMAYVGDYFEPKLRGRIMGTIAASISIAAVTGSIVGGISGGIDWKLIFAFMAIAGLISTISLAAFIVEIPRPSERRIPMMDNYLTALKHPLVLLIGVSGAAVFFIRWSLDTFVSYTVRAPPFNLDSTTWGTILSLRGIGGFAAGFPAGYLTDKIGRKSTVITGFSLIALTLLVYLTPLWFLGLPILYFSIGFFTGIAFTGLNTLIVEVEGTSREATTSIYGSMRFLGYALGPIAPQPLYDSQGLVGVALLDISLTILILLVWILRKNKFK